MMNFKPFSKKQLATLCWWGPDSPYREKDAIICDGAVRSGKSLCDFYVVWDDISLQDEVELARARLYRAQAERLEKEVN